MSLKRSRLFAIAVIASLSLLASSAMAVTLYSPPMTVPLDKSIECKLLNVSKSNRTVRIAIRTDEGGVASDMLMPPTVLEPGRVLSLGAPGAGACFLGDCEPSYCLFEVDGGRRTVRASACIADADGCSNVVAAQ